MKSFHETQKFNSYQSNEINGKTCEKEKVWYTIGKGGISCLLKTL